MTEVVITTSGWPIRPLPTEDDIKADRARAGYAEALKTWLDANPGVTIKQIEANIWDQQAIVTAISGGTAPTFVYAPAIGGWSLAGARAAFVQNLVADITPFVEKYGVKGKLTPAFLAFWEPQVNVDGKYYNYPIDAGTGNIPWIRRDLIKEAGLPEPTPDWTWTDFRTIAKALTSEKDKRKGAALQWWMVGGMQGHHGLNLLQNIPSPSTGWHWRVDLSDPKRVPLIQNYRAMIFEDQSVFSDASADENQYTAAFAQGSAAIRFTNILGAFGSAAQESSLAALAKRLDKPYEEVFLFLPPPKGDTDFYEGQIYVGGVSYSPDSSADVLDKGVGVVDYMFLGKGWDIQKAGQWEATKDLQAVFNYPLPIDGKYTYEGVPGSFADAWGKKTLEAIEYIARLSAEPDPGLYFPAEKNPAPDDKAINDAWSTFTYVADNVDIAAELKKAEQTWNKQAESFTSSVSAEDFTAAALRYYADLDTYFKEKMPIYYESMFKPWYDAKVKPALG